MTIFTEYYDIPPGEIDQDNFDEIFDDSFDICAQEPVGQTFLPLASSGVATRVITSVALLRAVEIGFTESSTQAYSYVAVTVSFRSN
jgi:hypothetical protein